MLWRQTVDHVIKLLLAMYYESADGQVYIKHSPIKRYLDTEKRAVFFSNTSPMCYFSTYRYVLIVMESTQPLILSYFSEAENPKTILLNN